MMLTIHLNILLLTVSTFPASCLRILSKLDEARPKIAHRPGPELA